MKMKPGFNYVVEDTPRTAFAPVIPGYPSEFRLSGDPAQDTADMNAAIDRHVAAGQEQLRRLGCSLRS